MSIKLPPKEVADAFVKQYYLILEKCPENAYKFYHEDSLLSWPGLDAQVTTLNGINDKIMSSDHKNGTVEIQTVDAQESQEGSVIVAVTGVVVAKDDNLTKYFTQTFFLAKQEKGFYVLNDILRVLDIPLMVTTDNGGTNDQPAAVASSEPTSDAKAVVEKKKFKDIVAEVAGANVGVLTTSFVHSPKKSGSDEKAEFPVSVWVQPVSLKVSYASVVARERAASPPKPSGVTPNVQKQKKSSTNAASNELAGSTRTTPWSPKVGGGGPSASPNIDTKGIYIGRLPYDITKQGLLDVVKQFGPVKRHPDNVQIIRHEDGFCCGFVEFESADSARRAVEAHHIKFGDKEESYISYKRSNKGTNGNGGRQSPTRASVQSTKGRESETIDQTRGRHQSLIRGRHQNNSRAMSR